MSNSKIGSGDMVLDFGVAIAALILFAKTADVLSYFSPTNINDLMGFDFGLLYGFTCASLVEGLALALHFNHRASHHPPAQIAKWMLLGISALCQIYDGYITTGSVDQMTETMKAVLSYGVPLIPLFIMIMMFGIGQLPALEEEESRTRKSFIGLKSMWRRLIDGDAKAQPAPQSTQSLAAEVPAAKLKSTKSKRTDGANPISGNES